MGAPLGYDNRWEVRIGISRSTPHVALALLLIVSYCSSVAVVSPHRDEDSRTARQRDAPSALRVLSLDKRLVGSYCVHKIE